jgi:predicted AAA+ superfamily ATPase
LKAEKDTNYIKVITGIRRVGKTTILNQYRRLFVSENVIDIDFNDARVAEQFD